MSDKLITFLMMAAYEVKRVSESVLLIANKIIWVFEDAEEVGEDMDLMKWCKKKGYVWTPEIERKHKFLLRSARIKNYSEKETNEIIYKVLRTNKYILTRKKSERLALAIQSVETVLKRQVARKKEG